MTNGLAGIFFVALYCFLRTRIPSYYTRGIKQSGFFSWLPKTIKLSDEAFVTAAGVDALVAIRLQIVGIKIFSTCTALSVLFLLPIYVTGENSQEGLNSLGLTNVESGSNRLWIAVITCYITSFVVLWIV